MAKLLVFAACEKVITAQDDNNPTLIALLAEMAVTIEVKEPLEKNALLPTRWSIFSMWRREDGDEGKTFEQLVRVLPPGTSKSIVGDNVSTWSFQGKTHRVSLHLPGLPAGGKSGDWELQCFGRETGSEWPTQPTATYTLSIHIDVKQVTPSEAP